MEVSPATHRILYISRLAPGCEFDTFVAVCRMVRSRHEETGCTGALLFDGYRFCHLLQGPPTAVRALMDELAADLRHGQLIVLADGEADAASRIAGLRSKLAAGYCDVDDLDVFESPQGLEGDAAVAAFSQALLNADLSP